MIPPGAILFDWDGTLADSLPLVTAATNEVLSAHGYRRMTEAEIHKGMRFATEPRFAYHITGRPDLTTEASAADRPAGISTPALASSGVQPDSASAPFSASHAALLADAFYTAADQLGHRYVSLFTGVRDMLDELQIIGIPMAIVTNNRSSTVRQIVRHLGLESFFPVIVGEQDVERPKPDPEPVRLALRALGLDAGADILFVGDSRTDAMAAAAAGVSSVGAAWPPVSAAHEPDHPFAHVVDEPQSLSVLIRGAKET